MIFQLEKKLNISEHSNLEKLKLPPIYSNVSVNSVVVTSGFGCINEKCMETRCAPFKMPKSRRYLPMEIVDSTNCFKSNKTLCAKALIRDDPTFYSRLCIVRILSS